MDAALESAVRALRAASQRAGCLCTFKPGDKKELARVCDLYPNLPPVYKRFLEKNDPQDALFSPAPGNAISLLAVAHLEDGQLGYSVHSTDGKDVIYILSDDGAKEKYHKPICTKTKKGSVKGVVSKKGDQMMIKPSKDGVKFDGE